MKKCCIAVIALLTSLCAFAVESAAQERKTVDVFANVYMSGNTVIGKVLEEAVAGYHVSSASFVALGFVHAGVDRGFYGGKVAYSYVRPDEASLQLVPNAGIGFLCGPFSGDSRQTKLTVELGCELRQYLGRKKSSFCGLGCKVLSIESIDVTFWGGLTFGMCF